MGSTLRSHSSAETSDLMIGMTGVLTIGPFGDMMAIDMKCLTSVLLRFRAKPRGRGPGGQRGPNARRNMSYKRSGQAMNQMNDRYRDDADSQWFKITVCIIDILV